MHEFGDTAAKLRPPPTISRTNRGNHGDAGVAVDAPPGSCDAPPANDREEGFDLDFVVVAHSHSAAVLGWIVEQRVDGQVATHRQPASHPS